MQMTASRIVKDLTLMACGAFSCAMIAAAPAVAQSADQERTDQVIAEVGGEKLYRSDFEDAFQGLPPETQQMGQETLYPRILESLIQQLVVIQTGLEQGLQDDPEIQKRMELVEAQLVRDLYLRRAVEAKIEEKDLQAAYDAWLEQNPPKEEVKARHILVETEEEARNIIKMVTDGQEFAELAKKYSKGPSASQGGDLGFFDRGSMVKPFADVAFALQPNQFSADPVKTKFGWHVILVEERRKGDSPSFEQLRPSLGRYVGEQMARQIAAELTAKSDVQRFDLSGKPMAAPATQ
ncbi:peptidylprolyl isomerase [Hwanghaeella grinnelliae]|nr:peptidylprolyl isomerase [Hwanghaeella grinnelliae]